MVCVSAINYAFGAGAAAGAAPPDAGAAPAARSSATFTEWPLKERVGANSPSLWPTICSVTYTGMNFFPLCTAIVCPIISGTIVERRDHVLMTFFSLRVFSPSTFSRRWPSTNGPFFVERAIACLFLHAAQTAPLGVPHFLESPHRTRYSMRLRTERANKSCAESVRRTIHDHRPARLAKLVKHRLKRYGQLGRGFHGRFRRRYFHGSLDDSLAHSLDWTRPSCSTACCPCRSHRSALPNQF